MRHIAIQGELLYTITQENDFTFSRACEYGPWAEHYKGSTITTVRNTGNGLVVKISDKKGVITLDYSQAEALIFALYYGYKLHELKVLSLIEEE